MALLSRRSVITAFWASAVATVLLGCSFVLDTEGLRKAGAGGTGGTGGTTQTGTGGSAGTPVADAASDAPTCPSPPDRNPCSECLAMHCCSETMRCTTNMSCNFAYVDFQRCQRVAKNAPNPMAASSLCTSAFINNGGMGASGLIGCTLTNCAMVCG